MRGAWGTARGHMLHNQVGWHTIMTAAVSFCGGGLQPDEEAIRRLSRSGRVVGGLSSRCERIGGVRLVEVYGEGQASASGDAAKPLASRMVKPCDPFPLGEGLRPFRKGPDFVRRPGGDDVLRHHPYWAAKGVLEGMGISGSAPGTIVPAREVEVGKEVLGL